MRLLRAAIALLALGAEGCADDPPVKGDRGSGQHAPAPVTRTALPAEPGEYWLVRFGRYMSADERRAYEGTPEADRYERFGARLLEYQRRDELVEPVRGRLDAESVREYERLPDYEACRKFLEGRFREGG